MSFQWRGPFNAHQRGKLVLVVAWAISLAENAMVILSGCRAACWYRCQSSHSAPGVMSLEFRLTQMEKKLCSQVALPDLVQIDMAFCYGRVLAQVKVFVEEALGRVGRAYPRSGQIGEWSGLDRP